MGIGMHIKSPEAFGVFVEEGNDLGGSHPNVGEFFGGVEGQDKFAHVAARGANNASFTAAVDTLFGRIFY